MAITLSRLRLPLFILILAVALRPRLCSGQPAPTGTERLVLAFYYPWYDFGTWNSGALSDMPETPYNSDDPATMSRQIEQAQGAGVDAFVVNWWGKGNRTEDNLTAILGVAAQKGFRIAASFDLNSPTMSGIATYAENLGHLHSVHAAQPAYLRVDGKPVVFFYNVSRLPLATWQSLRDKADPGHNALWIAEGTDLKYQSVFDGHHLYSITWSNGAAPAKVLAAWGRRLSQYNEQHGTAKLWVATVMPGYDDRGVRPGTGFARARDDGAYYSQCWQAAIASRPQWVIVNSFNEWAEGSHIEPSQAFGRLYLDLTAEWAARFRMADFTPSPASPTSIAPGGARTSPPAVRTQAQRAAEAEKPSGHPANPRFIPN